MLIIPTINNKVPAHGQLSIEGMRVKKDDRWLTDRWVLLLRIIWFIPWNNPFTIRLENRKEALVRYWIKHVINPTKLPATNATTTLKNKFGKVTGEKKNNLVATNAPHVKADSIAMKGTFNKVNSTYAPNAKGIYKKVCSTIEKNKNKN